MPVLVRVLCVCVSESVAVPGLLDSSLVCVLAPRLIGLSLPARILTWILVTVLSLAQTSASQVTRGAFNIYTNDTVWVVIGYRSLTSITVLVRLLRSFGFLVTIA